MGSAVLDPVSYFPNDVGLSEPTYTPINKFRRESNKPGIGIFISCTSFSS